MVTESKNQNGANIQPKIDVGHQNLIVTTREEACFRGGLVTKQQ